MIQFLKKRFSAVNDEISVKIKYDLLETILNVEDTLFDSFIQNVVEFSTQKELFFYPLSSTSNSENQIT